MKHFELILAAALCGSLCTGIALNAADAAPAKEAKKETKEEAKKTEIVWLTDFEAAKKQAAAEKKPILMFFTGSDWCHWCQKLHEEVLDKEDFKKFARDSVILLELDFPNSIPQSDALKKQNKELDEKFEVRGYPTMILVDSDGKKEIDRTVGYNADLLQKLKKAVKKDTVDAKKKSEEETADETGEKLAWLTDFEAAKKQAAAEKKPILMFFTGSDWCIWCQRLHEDVLDKDEFRDFSEKLVLVELDFPQGKQLPDELKKQNEELAEKFKVDGYPCTVVLASDGETKLGTLSGYSPEYIARIQDILDGKGKPVTMEALQKKFDYLPDMLVEYEDLKLTKDELLKELFEQEPTESECERITPESVGLMIQANLDDAILLYLAQKAGYTPSAQLVKDSVMKELDELPAEQRKDLEDALKAQGVSLEDQIAKAAEIETVQKQTAMQLFVNKHAEDAVKKDLSEDEILDHYEANRALFPGEFDAEKEKVLDTLVKAKAPSKAKELDKEIEKIRNTVKYWKPQK